MRGSQVGVLAACVVALVELGTDISLAVSLVDTTVMLLPFHLMLSFASSSLRAYQTHGGLFSIYFILI